MGWADERPTKKIKCWGVGRVSPTQQFYKVTKRRKGLPTLFSLYDRLFLEEKSFLFYS